MSQPVTEDSPGQEGLGLPTYIAQIAGTIGFDRFPTGERAALRRMSPGQAPLAFYRFAHRHLPEGWERQRDDWITIVAGMAIMAPNVHRGDRAFGEMLAAADYSEARLERLLASEGGTRRILLLRAARQLAAKGVAFNWTDAASLLLTRDPDKREAIHMRIAKSFYRAQDNRKKDKDKKST